MKNTKVYDDPEQTRFSISEASEKRFFINYANWFEFQAMQGSPITDSIWTVLNGTVSDSEVDGTRVSVKVKPDVGSQHVTLHNTIEVLGVYRACCSIVINVL